MDGLVVGGSNGAGRSGERGVGTSGYVAPTRDINGLSRLSQLGSPPYMYSRKPLILFSGFDPDLGDLGLARLAR